MDGHERKTKNKKKKEEEKDGIYGPGRFLLKVLSYFKDLFVDLIYIIKQIQLILVTKSIWYIDLYLSYRSQIESCNWNSLIHSKNQTQFDSFWKSAWK